MCVGPIARKQSLRIGGGDKVERARKKKEFSFEKMKHTEQLF